MARKQNLIGDASLIGLAVATAAYAPNYAFIILVIVTAAAMMYLLHKEHEMAKENILGLCTDLAKVDEHLKDLTLQVKALNKAMGKDTGEKDNKKKG
eukprot:m.338289 g.338289  ORF g.338289 m.338289 type:complete len:97 (+) comp18372_c0_seq1:180-470(+)